MTYTIIRGLLRLLLAIFYRRIEVHGLERVPARGPLVIAANHHNALVDPMLLLVTIPRRLAPLTKSTLFRHPVIAPFLWLSGAVPVHRRQDAGGGPVSNVDMFATAIDRLRDGGGILIFPEGVSRAIPTLQPLRTGIARLALDAATASPQAAPTVLPVGLVFHRPADFRAARAIVVIGEPVPFADLVARHREDPTEGVHALTERVASALRALIVEAEDMQTLRLLEVAHDVWHDSAEPAPSVERLAWMREAARRLHTLPEALRDRIDVLRREFERYAKDARGRADAPARIGRRRALWNVVRLVSGLPLALLGLAVHYPGYRVTAAAVHALRPEPDESATFQLATGLVLFPVSWALEAALLAWLGGAWAVAAFIVALAPSGFYALSWRSRVARLRRDLGAWTGDLATRRQWLRRELEELAELTR